MSADRAETAASEDTLSSAHRATLDAVLNLIVPPSADARLPGAAEVGVPEYLLAEARDALPELRRELDELDARALAAFSQAFAALDPARREALVGELRARDPSFMSRLALETVTCYYMHDRVLEGLGMEARPPAPKGYQVMMGDLTLLAPVRARGKIWRDA